MIIPPPDARVFDIGANNGDLTQHFLDCGAGSVICVEPQLHCIHSIYQRFHTDKRVKVLHAAVDQKPGIKPIQRCDAMAQLSTFNLDLWKTGRHSAHTWSTEEWCPMVTLDMLCERFGRPHYVKIGVEGFELPVLNGLSAALPLISFECHIEHKKELFKCLARLHYLGISQFFCHPAEVAFPLEPKWNCMEATINYINAQTDPLWWGNVFARSL